MYSVQAVGIRSVATALGKSRISLSPATYSLKMYFNSSASAASPSNVSPLINFDKIVPFNYKFSPSSFSSNSKISRLDSKTFRFYSTKTAPPPPPPSHDKNEKGKRILNKATRAFTFSLSSVIVLAATGVAVLVVYLILSELFLPSGDTRTFNKAVKLVEKSEIAQELLDFKPGHRLKAYGEVPGDRWVRNRPVQSIRTKGQDGKDHHVMKFHVESDAGKHATVILEQIDTSFWSSEFAYIALDKPGSKRVYIVEPRFQPKNYVPHLKDSNGFLGLKWGPKKDN